MTDYAIYLLDRSGVVTTWNPGAQRFKGYTADEIIGQHFSRFYTDEDRAADVPPAAPGDGQDARDALREGWRVRKDGSRFWAHVIIDAIRDDAETLSALPRSPATSPSVRRPRRNSKRRVSSRCNRRSSRPLVSSPVASPTTLTTCLSAVAWQSGTAAQAFARRPQKHRAA